MIPDEEKWRRFVTDALADYAARHDGVVLAQLHTAKEISEMKAQIAELTKRLDSLKGGSPE